LGFVLGAHKMKQPKVMSLVIALYKNFGLWLFAGGIIRLSFLLELKASEVIHKLWML